MRLFLTGLGVFVAGHAFASFDLMLLPGADGRIHRYDPVNQVSLGSVVSPNSNWLISSDGSGHMFYGSPQTSGVRQVKYSTGELMQIMAGVTPAVSLEHKDAFVYMTTSSVVSKLGVVPGTGSSGISLAAGITWRTSAIAGNFLHVVGTNAAGIIQVQSINLNTFTASSAFSTGIPTEPGSGFGKAAAATNAGTGVNQMMFSYVGGSGFNSLGRFNLNPDGSLVSTGLSTLSVSLYSTANAMPAVLEGHGGWWVYGQDSADATKARISRYDLFNSPLNSYSYTINAPGGGFNSIWSTAFQPHNVVAPEPGTIIALGAGLAAILRRKRNRKV